MQIFTDNLQWWIGGAIVVIGLLGFGLGDVARFSLTRVWAISSVNFAESIRRRVLWITPLAIVGIIAVSQLQRPVDEADAVRQTIKVCMFATGLVVSIVTIILACTNLPKEIENRVIYTVVTKPTTRLEIILGKIVGFARVSATILLIMGVFSWGYVAVRAWYLQREILQRIELGDPNPAAKATLEHYRQAGLLSSKTFSVPVSMQIYSRPPTSGDSRRWVYGNAEQDILVPFSVAPEDLVPAGMSSDDPNIPPVIIAAKMEYEQRKLTKEEEATQGAAIESADTGSAPIVGPVLPTTRPRALVANAPTPRVTIDIYDQNQNLLIGPDKLVPPLAVMVPADPRQPIQMQIPPAQIPTLQKAKRFFVQFTGATIATQYGIHVGTKPEESSVVLIVAGNPPRVIYPARAKDGNMITPLFRGRSGNYGQQLRGGNPGDAPVGVYAFRGASFYPDASGNVDFELKVGIEKSGNEDVVDDDLTDVEVNAINPQTLQVMAKTDVLPETNHITYFQLPASALGSGNFDLMLRNKTTGHWIGLRPASLAMVRTDQTFGYNLLKGLAILWLMSILVIVVSIFCSTFLSWPIAIVLTMLILLGHWGVEQIGDATESGIGNRVAQDLGFTKDAAQAKVVSSTVESLSKMLAVVSNVLPDISKFQASEDVERGVSIPIQRLLDALVVSVGFGIPLAVLAYVLLKNKEVAP